ncbi:TPM domain-containing protein [Enterococcus sp. AD013-P3]|uniref:TPM domain-containing protein n=1 Tax=Enterococcus sp. AD013-P3 TaxID=3411036 RepID=UPI003B95F9FD
MRKWLNFLTPVLLFLLTVILLPLNATADSTHIEDGARLFSDAQIQALENKAQSLGEKIKGNVYIVTNTNNTLEPAKFADEYLREKVGNDNNGAVLLMDMGQRELYISTSGNMIDYLDDNRISNILDQVYDAMSADNPYEAATAFYDQGADYVEAGVPRGHYRVDADTGKITYYRTISPLEAVIALLVAAVIAAAFFIVIKSKYQLKLGTYTYPYQENSDVNLTVNENQLINSFVTTRRIPRNTGGSGGSGGGGGSTTHSSGGGTFGGGGRSF